MFTKLRLANVRCFEEVTIPLDEQVTVIIGGNGSGKSTIVECLASLTHGETEGLTAFPARRGQKAGGAIELFDTRTSPAAKWMVSAKKPARLPESRYLFAYGRYRFFPDGETTVARDPGLLLDQFYSQASLHRTTTVSRTSFHLHQDLAGRLVALDEARTSDSRLTRTWKRMNEVMRELSRGVKGIEMRGAGVKRRPVLLRGGLELELRELSDGYQAFLVVLFDLLCRYPVLFPGLDEPLDGEAVVVIDEIDLHLHPQWQRDVVSQLRHLFRKTQFVLTTHSPTIVQGAVDRLRTVIALRERGGSVSAQPMSQAKLRKCSSRKWDPSCLRTISLAWNPAIRRNWTRSANEFARWRRRPRTSR